MLQVIFTPISSPEAGMSLTKRFTASGNVHMFSSEIQANPSYAFFSWMAAFRELFLKALTSLLLTKFDQNETES